MKPVHQQTKDEIIKAMRASGSGLSKREVKNRLQKYGRNQLPREKPLSLWLVLLRQFAGPMIIVLSIAAIISLILHEWVDAGVIAAAILLNTIIGFFQEVKAARALEKLRSLVQAKSVVRRGGQDVEIDSTEIVPGDILVFAAGDKISADARIIEAVELKANEAALTGESMPVNKHTKILKSGVALGDRKNMIFTGTHVVTGRGLAVVTATAVNTELGKIARLVKETKQDKTPLQKQLAQLARWIASLVVFLVLVLLVVGLFQGKGMKEMFELSVALAVAAIPEGLVVGVTIILAIGMQRILRRKSLVRRLIAAETLGSVSVICADKTGTITEGEMQVSELVTWDETTKAEKVGLKDSAEEHIKLLEFCMLCNNAAVNEGGELKEVEVTGSPTEKALLHAGLQASIKYGDLVDNNKRFAEIPFNSTRKYMATLNSWEGSQAIIVKGAPEKLIKMVSKTLVKGKEKSTSDADKKKLESTAVKMTKRGLRVLAVAYKTTKADKKTLNNNDLEDLVFVGFVGLRDPLRSGVEEQIIAAKGAGVRTIIITGDHPNTARAIAKEAGLIEKSDHEIALGTDLDAWDDQTLKSKAKTISVYARVEPRHKIRIVNALQELGAVVAMTGDGVNDAPALKAADIGVAVGSGTEVAKEASDMVILDNNFSTITAAIEQGRVIFDNIRRTTVYLLADSFTEIILIAGALFMHLPLPLLPLQILWINLIADSLPNVGLTFEPGEPDIMKMPPRKRNEPVLNWEMIVLIFIIGVITDIVLFAIYVWFLKDTGDEQLARTIMFAAVGIDSLIYIFAIKSFRRSIFKTNIFSNMWLIGGVLIGFALLLLALLHPTFQVYFEVSPLNLSNWGLLIILGLVKLVAIEIAKDYFIIRRKQKYGLQKT